RHRSGRDPRPARPGPARSSPASHRSAVRAAPAYHQHGHACGQRVEEHRRHGAAVLRARVGLAVRALVAEEALHVDGEGVRVLEVISQHHGPCHDHHLEVKHAVHEDAAKPENSRKRKTQVTKVSYKDTKHL
uniref:Uncharacterized protein n=1 Tax=Zonotrichia albicollis TaxID=44394 RepID=A0A8D2MLH9_ZONAL